MKLPIPTLLSKKKVSSEHYLALMLRDEKVIAVIMEEIEGKIKVIGRHEEFLTTPLEDFAYEELLNILDKTISRAEETLPNSIETEKTVFGVKESWVEEKKIKKEYLSRLKKICDELSLSPIGFMVIPETIAHLLQKEEGAPLSAVLAEIGQKDVTLTLFRAGKILDSHTKAIEGSLTKTVDTLLHHFTSDVLPSRIILFNIGENEEISQHFIAHHFSKSIPFLHVPQISLLPTGFDAQAMVFGAAEQMGLEVFSTPGDSKTIDLTPSTKPDSSVFKGSHIPEDESEKTSDDKDTKKDDAEAFGFVVNEDVATIKPTPYKKPDEESLSHPDFIVNKAQHDNLKSPIYKANDGENDTSEDVAEEKKGFFTSLPHFSLLRTIRGKIPLLGGGSSLPLPKGKLLYILPVIFIALIGLVLLYIFQMNASVTITLEPKEIEKEEQVTLALGAANNFSENVIAAKEVEVQLEGTSTQNVTGKKEKGEKAKGNTTIISSVTREQTVPEGTLFTSSNGLGFVSDKSVKLASSSGVSDIKSVEVSLTAKVIGKEFNLPSNTKFAVGNFEKSSVEAKNEKAFSGGSKEEVTIFSKKDADTLSENLPKSLEDEARTALKEKVGNGEIALPVFTDITLTKKNFDKDVNEETKKVTLKATVLFTSLSYTESDLKDLSQSLLKGDFAQNLSLSDKGTKNTLKDIKVKNDEEISATLAIKAGLLPQLKTEDIASEISGKSFMQAAEYIKTLPQVKNSEIVLTPNIPFLPKYLPRLGKNISVSLRSQ